MKRETLGSLPVGQVFEFGGVKFVKNQTAEPTNDLIYCSILNQPQSLYISDCALVNIEEPTEKSKEQKALESSPFMTKAQDFFISVREYCNQPKSGEQPDKSIIVLAYDNSLEDENVLALCGMAGNHGVLVNGVTNSLVNESENFFNVMSESLMLASEFRNPILSKIKDIIKSKIENDDCPCPSCTARRERNKQNPNVN